MHSRSAVAIRTGSSFEPASSKRSRSPRRKGRELLAVKASWTQAARRALRHSKLRLKLPLAKATAGAVLT
jgi:hypothetical protein